MQTRLELRIILSILSLSFYFKNGNYRYKTFMSQFPVFFFLSIVAALLRYNAHTIEFIHVYNSVFFSIFAGLCNYQYNLIWEHFHHPPKETLCILVVILYSSSSISGETSFYFLCHIYASSGHLMEPFDMWSFMTGFFQLEYFQGSFML